MVKTNKVRLRRNDGGTGAERWLLIKKAHARLTRLLHTVSAFDEHEDDPPLGGTDWRMDLEQEETDQAIDDLINREALLAFDTLESAILNE